MGDLPLGKYKSINIVEITVHGLHGPPPSGRSLFHVYMPCSRGPDRTPIYAGFCLTSKIIRWMPICLFYHENIGF